MIDGNAEVRPFTPEPAGLPEQYSHFDKLESYIGDLKALQDTSFTSEAYPLAWTVLCMTMDKPDHERLSGELTNKTQGAEPTQEQLDEFNEGLTEVSAYPIYRRISGQLKSDHYVDKKMNQFKKWYGSDTPPVGIGLDGKTPTSDAHKFELFNLAAKYFPSVYDTELMDQAVGTLSMKKRGDPKFLAGFRSSEAFVRQIHEMGAEQAEPYVALTMILGGARRLSNDVLMDTIDGIHKGSRSFTDKELRINSLLVKTEPYHRVAQVLPSVMDQAAIELFGQEHAEEAGSLWRTLVFLRTSSLPSKKRNFYRGILF